MTPQVNQKLPPTPDTTTSPYFHGREHAGGPGTFFRRTKGNTVNNDLAIARATPSLGGLPSPVCPQPNRGQIKRKYVDDGTFDFGENPSAAGVKEESQDDEPGPRTAILTRQFPVTKTNQRPVATKPTSPGPRTRETSQTSSVIPSGPQERSAIVATLVHVCDNTVIAAAVALVLRWARHPTLSCHGDVYDTTFIQNIIADLDDQGIEATRRASITAMLARPLQQQLESLRSSSESLSLCLASITTPQPSSPLSRHSG